MAGEEVEEDLPVPPAPAAAPPPVTELPLALASSLWLRILRRQRALERSHACAEMPPTEGRSRRLVRVGASCGDTRISSLRMPTLYRIE